jgi:23S rRNA (guanosine2251-2'-O)-methyltransferase
MYKIYGKHAINCIMNNSKRKTKKKHKDYVETDKLFIETPLDEIIANYKRIILLDNNKDVRNVGSIIRSAAILGFAVLLRDRCCVNEISVKCASGGMDKTAITFVSDIRNTINKLKNNEFWFVALNENGSKDTIKFDKIVLIIGAEDCGISGVLLDACDHKWCLNSMDVFNIYNASVSASIAMYEMFRMQSLSQKTNI